MTAYTAEAYTVEPGVFVYVRWAEGMVLSAAPGDPGARLLRVRAAVAVRLNDTHGLTGNGVQLVLDTPDRDTLTVHRWDELHIQPSE